jgi:hypothetical protein
MSERIEGTRRKLLPGFVRNAVSRKTAFRAGVVLLALLVFYYPAGMLLTHVVDDDVEFQAGPEDRVEGGSHAVAIAAALIDREVNQHRWVANDPWFLPPAALDNMPNFQQGIVGALARFAFELVDQIGRSRGSSQTDRDLQEASGQLQYSGNIWVFDLSTSLAPTTPSESRYRKARQSLNTYNKRVAQGSAVFERRADNLLATLDRITLDLGASSAAIDQHIATHSGGPFDFRADDIFYGVKGQTYAYYLLLRELAKDYEALIGERALTTVWAQMLESLRHAATLSPLVISNASPDSALLPNHLAAQGFYLLRARAQLREVTNILLK